MAANGFNSDDFSLLRLVPQIVRARDFRLYTKDGKRLVDLWQNGGAAVLGHTPPAMLRELKNTASRGLYAPFPHFMEQRFIKALSRLLPGRSFRIYATPPNNFFSDNVLREMFKDGSTALWRPFLDFGLPENVQTAGDTSVSLEATSLDAAPPSAKTPAPQAPAPRLVIPVLPGIQGWRSGLPQGLPFGLCVLAASGGFEGEYASLPPGDFLPPVLLAAATRGIWDLIAASPERANVQWPRVNKALRNSPWLRRGIYLFPKEAHNGTDSPLASSPEAWADLFRRFLDAGFLLPPVQEHPIILPGILSPGEEAKLAEVFTRDSVAQGPGTASSARYAVGTGEGMTFQG
jgi:hypothetical protein